MCRKNAAIWVYPEGVPERSYQVEIIHSALLNNVLVCLPTGLGKTLIAAVVMHNFSRWFPEVRPSKSTRMASCPTATEHLRLAFTLQGKVVFVAPTKPLVNQQVDACRKFMGMPEVSVGGAARLPDPWMFPVDQGDEKICLMQRMLHELTGQTESERRAEIWSIPHKRIFFCTPQVFKNDVCRGEPSLLPHVASQPACQAILMQASWASQGGVMLPPGICPAEKVTCIVVDECHRATGKTDIVLALRAMAAENYKFRVLGLSATPGRDRAAIQVRFQPVTAPTSWSSTHTWHDGMLYSVWFLVNHQKFGGTVFFGVLPALDKVS